MMAERVCLVDAHFFRSGAGSTLLLLGQCMIEFVVMVCILSICTKVSFLSLSWVSLSIGEGYWTPWIQSFEGLIFIVNPGWRILIFCHLFYRVDI